MAEDEEGTPAKLRLRIRQGIHTEHTSGLCTSFVQANLVILPQKYAYDFMTFCLRNQKPCPLLDVTEPGNPMAPRWLTIQESADLRTDLPKYRVYQNGDLMKEVTDIREYWREDSVAFLIGCSFSFEDALLKANLPVRHQEEQKNVPMYRTNIPCRPAGVFDEGMMVVSMRPYRPEQVSRVIQITARYKAVHGAPIHTGDPAAIGIDDIGNPSYGEPVTVKEGEVPVFFACGVTPQEVIRKAKIEGIVITHSPGCMFVTDLLNEELTLS